MNAAGAAKGESARPNYSKGFLFFFFLLDPNQKKKLVWAKSRLLEVETLMLVCGEMTCAMMVAAGIRRWIYTAWLDPGRSRPGQAYLLCLSYLGSFDDGATTDRGRYYGTFIADSVGGILGLGLQSFIKRVGRREGREFLIRFLL